MEDSIIFAFILWDMIDFFGKGWIFYDQWMKFLEALQNFAWLGAKVRKYYHDRLDLIGKLRMYSTSPWVTPWLGCLNILSSFQFQDADIPLLKTTLSRSAPDASSRDMKTQYAYSPFTGLWKFNPSDSRRERITQDDSSLFTFGRKGVVYPGYYHNDYEASSEDRGIHYNHFAFKFHDGKYKAIDLGSIRGSYFRLKERAILRKDDMYLIGDQNLFKVFTATLCQGRERSPDYGTTFIEFNRALPELEPVVDPTQCGFETNKAAPEISTHVHGGEFMRTSMKNFNTVDGEKRRHQELISFGRKNCTFDFKDRLISTNHCKIYWIPRIGFILEDNGSRNGTWWCMSRFSDFCIDAPSQMREVLAEDIVKIGKLNITIDFIG